MPRKPMVCPHGISPKRNCLECRREYKSRKSNPKQPKNCEVCGTQFQAREVTRKYCSRACYFKAQNERRKQRRREKRALKPKPKPKPKKTNRPKPSPKEAKAKMAKPNRPDCPNCGSTRIWSNGKKWQCQDCYKRFDKSPQEIADYLKARGIEPKKVYVMKNPTKVSCVVCGEEHVIDNPNSEVGLFYCTKCLREYGGKTPNSKIEGRERIRISVPKLGVD